MTRISARSRSFAWPSRWGPLDRLARSLWCHFLASLTCGRLVLLEGGRTWQFGPAAAPEARMIIHHPGCYRRFLLGGSRGLAEAYLDGWWTTPDLTAVLRLLLRQASRLEPLLNWASRLLAPVFYLRHLQRRNTLAGSRRNIMAHYDLGNDFYALMLDETMTYSCGLFPRPDSTLEEAALAKYDRICRKLDLKPTDEVLEIGCGWGGFALYAARTYGCRVTATTISPAQYDYARQQVAARGLAERVTILGQDYRQLTGTYDKLVSIEMIEAVGFDYLDEFLRVCSDRLRPDGLLCLQAITIRDQIFRRYLRSYDFIRSHVFPGSCLISLSAFLAAAARVTDLRLLHLEDITPHYVRTLQLWREHFRHHLNQIRALGYQEDFIRLWDFYLCYCESGFAERYIGDVQLLLAKPESRYFPSLPPLPIPGCETAPDRF